MALQLGDSIPNFSAVATDGSVFESASVVGKKPIVFYFYPKDDTRICTQQACAFRDQYEDFIALGAEVIGISGDSLQSHQRFAAKYQLPFLLLSDTNSQLRRLFGVPKDLLGLVPGRVTYVVDQEGILRFVFNSMSGAIHIQKALGYLKSV